MEEPSLKPIYIKNFYSFSSDTLEKLSTEINWLNEQERRQESFQSYSDKHLEYQYIENGPIYKSVTFHPLVKLFMEDINNQYGYNMNVCFLNKYDNDLQSLGWHSDDATQIDQSQPIVVLSFGQEREIWWKPKDQKGEIPLDQRQLLENGSCFIMPAGFQDDYFHRIPKGNRPMSTRISLTYRCWKNL